MIIELLALFYFIWDFLQICYVTIGKDAYLLEVPESLTQEIPEEFELRSSKKVQYLAMHSVLLEWVDCLFQKQVLCRAKAFLVIGKISALCD